MKARKRNRGADGIFDVNMTPLIDVSLVLVVILMVATPMAFQSSIAVRSAAATGQAATQVSDADWIEVTVVSEDTMLVNRALVTRATLEPAIGALVRTSPTRHVVVRCAERVSHGTFVAVLDAARRSGAAQIAVMGR